MYIEIYSPIDELKEFEDVMLHAVLIPSTKFNK